MPADVLTNLSDISVKVLKTSDDFGPSNLWVASEERLSDFYASAWQHGESGVPMLLVRLVMAGLGVAMLAWAVAESPNPFFLIYLTNWGLIGVAAMPVSAIIVSISALLNFIPEGVGVPPWYVGTYWVLYNISITLALTISLLYWALLFNPDICEKKDRLCWLELVTHTVNAAVVLVELLAARTPVRFVHIYMPICIGIFYIVFTWIYYRVDGTDGEGSSTIYEVLDWENPGRTWLLMFFATVAMSLLYAVVWGVALFRDWVTGELIRTERHSLPFPP